MTSHNRSSPYSPEEIQNRIKYKKRRYGSNYADVHRDYQKLADAHQREYNEREERRASDQFWDCTTDGSRW